jgi:hypothetical protein
MSDNSVYPKFIVPYSDQVLFSTYITAILKDTNAI